MLFDRLDTLARLAVIERPSCRKCRHPLTVERISPGARGFQELTFKCSTCGQFKRFSTAIDPVRTDMLVGWPANSGHPSRFQVVPWHCRFSTPSPAKV
jgi:hypothetical protein